MIQVPTASLQNPRGSNTLACSDGAVGALHPAKEAKKGSVVRLGADALDGAALAASSERLSPIEQVPLQLSLEHRRHALEDVGFEPLVVVLVRLERRHRLHQHQVRLARPQQHRHRPQMALHWALRRHRH